MTEKVVVGAFLTVLTVWLTYSFQANRKPALPDVLPIMPVKWQAASFEEALALAKQHERPIVAVFGAKWCLPCKRLDGTLSDAKVVTELSRRFVYVHVDGDMRKDLVKQFGVKAYPTYHILQPSGVSVRYGTGYKAPAEFIGWLGQADANNERDL